MNDGKGIERRAGDVGVVHGGNDAYVEGVEPFVFIDFEECDSFAKRQV